jgi:protocadherin-16/23
MWYQVSAVRSDARRIRINYTLASGNEDGAFEIDSSSGVIRVKNSTNLDRERQAKFRLVIAGKEEGSLLQFAHTVVQITLLDVNDNYPHFTQESYIASVWEGNTKGTFVTQVWIYLE